MSISFSISTNGDSQKTGTTWKAVVEGTDDPPFVVGQTVPYNDGDGPHRGLYQTRVLKQIPSLYFDRQEAAGRIGLWAHFIWPTVAAESAGGHHLLINTYDRARFTFGFYQLAAHTPNDNLILLFRELLTLSTAADYFPDLALKDGKVHRDDGGTLQPLEVVTNVKRPNGKFEDQILGFMAYLNPLTLEVGTIEAINAARLMHWLLNDPQAVAASERVAVAILRRKVKAQAAAYGLTGKDPRLAIWVSDIRHQGRGGSTAIKAALAEPTLPAKLKALFQVGHAISNYDDRRKTVQKMIAQLDNEGVFNGVVLGDAALPLD